jgi:alginate O-acetyltransferase complex protein AlgJ
MNTPFTFRPVYNWMLILLFLGVLFLPPLKMIISPESRWSTAEQRVLAPRPTLPTTIKQLGTFFSQTDNYFKDHFGFRDNFIHSYQHEMEKRFNQIGVNAPVLKGLDGWYFLTADKVLEDFRGETPLSQEQLEQWLAAQEKKAAWLKQHGIAYILAAGPDKQSIYPEYLTENAMEVKGVSRFEQMLTALDQHLPPYLVNLHSVLRQAKGEKNLYYKNDTHWNMLGGYLAFQAIFKRIAEMFPTQTFKTDFALSDDVEGIKGNPAHYGDLARMLMKEEELAETSPRFKTFQPCGHRLPFPYHLSNFTPTPGRISFAKGCQQAELTAVVFRDSFMVALEPFFSENFKKVIYLWKEYDQKNIEEIMTSFKPDIVIEITVERFLFNSVMPHPGSQPEK